jgi:hypothetical protein
MLLGKEDAKQNPDFFWYEEQNIPENKKIILVHHL